LQLALSFITKMALVSSGPKRQIKAIGSMHTEAPDKLSEFSVLGIGQNG
jgi:hypothetical protein